MEEPARKRLKIAKDRPSTPPVQHPEGYQLDKIEEIEEEEEEEVEEDVVPEGAKSSDSFNIENTVEGYMFATPDVSKAYIHLPIEDALE